MILTDIYVPAMNETYDFQLDESVPVWMLIDEIAEILQKKAGGTPEKSGRSFVLGSYEKGTLLDPSRTLQENGVRNGSRMFIV